MIDNTLLRLAPRANNVSNALFRGDGTALGLLAVAGRYRLDL